MGSRTAANPATLQTLPDVTATLSPEYELFATLVASGKSYRQSAEQAGFHINHGWKLMRIPEVRSRVNEIIESYKAEDLGGIASRAWIETQIVCMVQKLDNGLEDNEREDARLQLQALMALAKLKGLIVERKQVANAHVDLGKLDKEASASMLANYLGQLNPGARAELAAAGKLVDAEP